MHHQARRFTPAGFPLGRGPTLRSETLRIPNRPRTAVGSTFRLGRNRALLWTTGFIHQLDTYPGREVPNPLLVEICRGEADLDTVLHDVMGLRRCATSMFGRASSSSFQKLEIEPSLRSV